jgi:EndoU nuclease-like protein
MRVGEFAEGKRGQERRPSEPAPLPLHAMLALQQSAGNQAVDDAVNQLTTDGVIDASDAEFFVAETGATKKTASTRMAETRGTSMAAEIAEKRPGIEGKYKQHIFFGDFKADKKTPTGYHSIKGPSTTHARYGTASDVATDAPIGGVYQQSVHSVADPTKTKEYQSTFFPDEATMDEILDAITSVYGVTPQPKAVTYPARFKGMKLRKTGNTIYPEGTDKFSE